MSSSQSVVDFVVNQLQQAGNVRARKMFGEYALYCNEKVVALICDDQLFVKITPISHNFLSSEYEAPPYPGAKNYLNVPEEKWEDARWLSDFILQTANQLPIPKPKVKKTAKK